jgi:hypothetical protein
MRRGDEAAVLFLRAGHERRREVWALFAGLGMELAV